uniref:Glucoside xylosyltransferase 1 n=1 Tax=Cacopsylla melanoneura TaxID=428564 RepID=A0A8D8Z171_9HEMI
MMMLSIRYLFCAIILCSGILILVYLLNLTADTKHHEQRTMHHLDALKMTKAVPLGQNQLKHSEPRLFVENEHEEITIAIVICGDVLQQGFSLIKSAIIFQQKHVLKFVIFTEENLIQSIEEKLSDWQVLKNHSFSFEILNLQFPKNREKEWKTLFKKCASQRLFFADILPHIEVKLADIPEGRSVTFNIKRNCVGFPAPLRLAEVNVRSLWYGQHLEGNTPV